MKIVVTGGLGFIGSNFVRYMLETYRDVRIVNVDKKTYAGNTDNLADIAKTSRYKWIKADICDRAKMKKALAGADAVVHFAAETHVDRSLLDPDIFIKTNVLGTQSLLDAAKENKIRRFVHVSTDEVYGSVEKGESVEGDNLVPNSPYSVSKAASDMLVRAYYVTYGMPVMITRCSNNFGPYQYPEKAIPLLVSNASQDIPFPLYGDGLNVRDWLFVVDHVRAIDAVLRKGKPGEVYNIGGGESLSNIKMIRTVLKVMGKSESLIKRVPDRPGHDRRYALSCRKIMKELGWKPKYSFEQAIKYTVDWYLSNKKWWEKAKKASLYRKYYSRQYGGK